MGRSGNHSSFDRTSRMEFGASFKFGEQTGCSVLERLFSNDSSELSSRVSAWITNAPYHMKVIFTILLVLETNMRVPSPIDDRVLNRGGEAS